MDRWDWQAVKAYAPTMALMAGGVVAGLFKLKLAGAMVFSGVVETFGWVPDAFFVAALGHAAWMTWRLWRAYNGHGLLCACGGLLGAEIDGKYGPYRRCMACNSNLAARHYE